MTDNEIDAIRSRYLGVDKKKRKIRKMNDRKFVFDWDEQDDTFNAETPSAVGSQRQGAQIMFGRGHIAGMDDGGGVLPGGRRNPNEGGMQLVDPLERRKAAKSGLDERHWSEKPLEEMKERDWRIFREDFSIAARGTHTYSCRHSLVSSLHLRWSDSTPTAFLGRIYNPSANSGHCRPDRLQGTFSHSTAGHSDRSAES